MKRKNLRKASFHREAMIGSPSKTCVVFYDGNNRKLKLDRSIASGSINNLKNMVKSQFYIFGPGVYYLTVYNDKGFSEEFVACLYSDKFVAGEVRIDLEEDRFYEYTIDEDRGNH